MKVDRLVNNDKSLNAFIKIAEEQLASLMKSEKGSDFGQMKSIIQKGLGFTINPMTYTVGEFYADIKLLEQQAKQNKAQQNG